MGNVQVGSSFDRTAHMPFRLDHKGMNKDLTVKDQLKGLNKSVCEEVKIPTHWAKTGNTNPNRTFTEVVANRRRANQPDMSYDLDGDGVVGNRDLVLSKLFDKDGDGRLNTQERRNAEEAIKNVSQHRTFFLNNDLFRRESTIKWSGT